MASGGSLGPQKSKETHRMLVEIEVSPLMNGGASDLGVVDKAIALIRDSKMKYEVHALGTTIEGPPEQMWPLLRAVHDSCIHNGAEKVCTNIKVYENTKNDPADTIDGRKEKVKEP